MQNAGISQLRIMAALDIARRKASPHIWPLAMSILLGTSICIAEPLRGGLLGEPFTFVGVPKAFSKKTFRDLDGLERGLLVQVMRVTAGRLDSKQVEFPIPANQPAPLKIGVTYAITAGYGQHGLVILESREIK